MGSQKGEVLRVNDFGLCEVALPGGIRKAFTLDKLNGYLGESPRPRSKARSSPEGPSCS